MRRLGVYLALSAVVFALLGASCGGDGGSGGDADPAEVLGQAVRRFQGVKTFHFTLDHENGSTDIVFGLALDTAEGDFVLPDRMSGEARGKVGPTTLSVRLVAIGDATWITNPFSREFQRVPGSLLDIINPAALVGAVARSIREARLQGSEELDGTQTYRIRGKITSDEISEGLSFGDSGRELDVEVWVGRDDSLIRRARLKGALIPSESADIVRELNLSKYDAPVTVEEPR